MLEGNYFSSFSSSICHRIIYSCYHLISYRFLNSDFIGKGCAFSARLPFFNTFFSFFPIIFYVLKIVNWWLNEKLRSRDMIPISIMFENHFSFAIVQSEATTYAPCSSMPRMKTLPPPKQELTKPVFSCCSKCRK